MIQFLLGLPTWQMIRVFGVVSFLLLAAGMCLGVLYSYPLWTGKAKAGLYKWHTRCTNAGMVIGLLHGVITVIDTYMPFSWREVLIPFAAQNHTILNGLGTLAGYGTLVLVFTSDFRHKIGKKIWLAIHLMSYPVFAASLIHGFFEGTDSGLPGIRWMYLVSLGALVLLTVVRSFIRSGGSDSRVAARVK
jgi:methionine sulfoxide reductase heme-binding subunit